MPAQVRVLAEHVANQIAAGEVIERPAAVIKELLENSLDAGATRVEIEFANGGRTYMRIEDNGSGMTRDNALRSFERHATSKITEAADLTEILSFGFRGEALPSIASVSKFTLQTRPVSDDSGTEILINAGKLVHTRDCGRPVGTRIEVAQLFNSVPVRRKFLKTDSTEAAHIINAVRLYALSFPEVAFTLIENGRTVFHSPPCPDLAARISEIYGPRLAEQLLPLNATENNIHIEGLVGTPSLARSTRHEIITFINRRPVDSRALNYAIIESYHEILPKGRYPVAFLFLEIDPSTVDVNVHPAKREVRLRNEPQIRHLIITTLLKTLRTTFPTTTTPPAPPPTIPTLHPIFTTPATPPVSRTLPPETPPLSPNPTPALGGAMSASPDAPKSAPPPPPPPTSTSTTPKPIQTPPPNPIRPSPPQPPPFRFLSIAHQTYALFETPSGILILDRKAAAERILFERLQTQFAQNQIQQQQLLLPIPVELSPIDASTLSTHLDFLQQHALGISPFGRNFFRIESIPAWMDPADAEPHLRDIIGALRENRLDPRNIDLARIELARLSSTRSTKLSPNPTPHEMLILLTTLYACRSPLTTPSGRPTQFELPNSELSRRLQKP